jgi:hypothetical protein
VYVIGNIAIKDLEKWIAYRDQVPATLIPWNGEYRHADTVVLRFPDMESARLTCVLGAGAFRHSFSSFCRSHASAATPAYWLNPATFSTWVNRSSSIHVHIIRYVFA